MLSIGTGTEHLKATQLWRLRKLLSTEFAASQPVPNSYVTFVIIKTPHATAKFGCQLDRIEGTSEAYRRACLWRFSRED